MSMRLKRLTADGELVKSAFDGHGNISVEPLSGDPPDKYRITYLVKGIFMSPEGTLMALDRHVVEISLHAEYPRYKPVCTILTPIWHPNFRDGQICIGDIWGAGESLADIIVNIGDMIQYKSWNSFSPLSADAAKWAMEHSDMFPIGDANLYRAESSGEPAPVEIDMAEEEAPAGPTAAIFTLPQDEPEPATPGNPAAADFQTKRDEVPEGFEITAEELAGIRFVPSAQRMHTMQMQHGFVQKKRVNFKTVFMKGMLWGIIGAVLGFGITELFQVSENGKQAIADVVGSTELSAYFWYSNEAEKYYTDAMERFEAYCEQNGLDPKSQSALEKWTLGLSSEEEALVEQYNGALTKAYTALDAANSSFGGTDEEFKAHVFFIVRASSALWAGLLALFIGLMLGVGEGVFYGSSRRAWRYAMIGAFVSLAVGLVSGYLAQWMYGDLISADASPFAAALIRGLGWSIMGLGVGLAAGLIKPAVKRLLFCALGGLIGAFIGGFLFNYVTEVVPNGLAARGAGLLVMGLLVGLGTGLLEQFAKSAWLKVTRGEFEGKEYLVFAGVTPIGNSGRNAIALFKDRLVSPEHCEIRQEGSRYEIIDKNSAMGTYVNGQRITQRMLHKGDQIALGNSVLVFNTK